MSDTSDRFWSEPISRARRTGRYERAASAAELDGDLAVLRAVSEVQVRRRRWCAGLAIAALVGGVVAVTQIRRADALTFAPAAAAAVVLLVGRRFVGRWQQRRVDYASGLLDGLDLAGEVRLTLDLNKTHRRKFFVRDRDSTSLYANVWFELEAALPSGDRLRCARTEHLAYTERRPSTQEVRMHWSYEFEDAVTLVFAKPHAPLDGVGADGVPLREGLRLVTLEGDATSWRLAVRSDRVWSASVDGHATEGVQAVALALTWVKSLTQLAGQPSPLASAPRSPARARVWTVGSRHIAVLLFAMALPSAGWAALRTSDYRERAPSAQVSPYAIQEIERSREKVLREAMVAAAGAVGSLVLGFALWRLPPSLARARRRP